MAMADRGQAAVQDSGCAKDNDETPSNDISIAWSVDVRPAVENDERRNSPSGAPENDPGTTATGINLQILRRPTRKLVDPDEDRTDAPLPVPARVELDVGFERGVPIPDLPHPPMGASLKSEAFDSIRQLFLDDTATPQQEARVDEDGSDVSSSDESDGDVRGMFAVDGLKYFLGNIPLDDVTMASQDYILLPED